MSTSLDGIDLDFRPRSYFWPMGAETHLLARIKGAERKEHARRLIEAGRIDLIHESFGKSALSEDERQAAGRVHPAFMGGEFLPDLSREEVEIARINIASTTSDVTSVYARRQRGRIVYRVVDEYEGETLAEPTQRTSLRPLTLGQLERFFLTAWALNEVLEGNDLDLEGSLAFTRPSSVFYPQFGALICRRIHQWRQAPVEAASDQFNRSE